MSKIEDPLLTDKEVAKRTRRTTSWLAKARMYGSGPRFLKMGRKIFYRSSAVAEWLASLERASTSDFKRAS